ncbi:HEAT repeat domain-containing protein [Curtobacterium sp. RRHDQ66]|uniref:HEAT repeat domain-containing protein n=1 Tax=Curtobacterium guangdongense TaxID=3413380 RepID=UPI003BF2C832
MAETAESAVEHRAMLEALSRLGYQFDDMTAFANSRLRHKDAVPLLLNLLKSVENPMNRLRFAHALTTPAAKGVAVPGLLEAFTRTPNDDPIRVRWAIGSAIEATFDDAYADEVSSLALDRQYGRDREMLALALRKSRKEEVIDVLLDLTRDPDVDGHAIDALSHSANPRARQVFEEKLFDRRAWVRKRAAAGLRKLDAQK